MDIRDAETGDLPGILAIYNDVVRTSTAIYADDEVTLENRRAWYDDRMRQAFPVLVAVDHVGIAGFASFGQFRSFPGYRYTVEHSVHVRVDARGGGLGRHLMEALIPRAVAAGMHAMIAGIDATNAGSIRFHEKLGFFRVGTFPEVGWKFGRWLDLVCLQRWLDEPGSRR